MSGVNISPQSVSGECNYKCSYSINYIKQPFSVTNYGQYLGLSYNNAVADSVFNGKKMKVESIMIKQPSTLKYNNEFADAEITISLVAELVGQSLKVYIPISSDGRRNDASNLLKQIVVSTSKTAPTSGENTDKGMDELDLNKIIPKGQFYSFKNDEDNTNGIAYSLNDSIHMSEDNIKLLQEMLTMRSSLMTPNTEIFVNPAGATRGTLISGNEIYIDCQPTDSSEQTIDVSYEKVPATKFDLEELTHNIVFEIAMASIGFVALMLAVNYLLNYIKKKA